MVVGTYSACAYLDLPHPFHMNHFSEVTISENVGRWSASLSSANQGICIWLTCCHPMVAEFLFLNKIMLLSKIVERAQWLPLIGVSSPECMNTRGPVWENFLVKIQSPKACVVKHMMVIQWVMPSFKTHTYRMIIGISWVLLEDTEKQNCPDSKNGFRHQKSCANHFSPCKVLCDLLKPIYSE